MLFFFFCIFRCVFLNCETQYNFVLKNTRMTQKHNLHWCLCCSLYYKMHKTFFFLLRKDPHMCITCLFKVQMGYKRQCNTMMPVSTAQQEGDLSSGIWNQTPADIQMKTNRQKTQCSSKGCARAHAYAAAWLNEACCDTLLRNVYDSKTERIIVTAR